jgi:hypothetical protein
MKPLSWKKILQFVEFKINLDCKSPSVCQRIFCITETKQNGVTLRTRVVLSAWWPTHNFVK